MVRLFIENKEIELDESVQIAITKEFEELSNPTIIINDWSKTVSIPFTTTNNNIFGHIYNPDKAVVDGGTIGVYFNPLLKLNFRLEWDNSIIMVGYAKLNEVKQIAGKGTYEITLFGELGKVFQEMQKITFDTSTEDTDYLIHGEDYVDEAINKELIYESWNSEGQTNSDLKKKTDSGYSVTDIIGFAPNNSFSSNFDYKTLQTDVKASGKFEDFLGSGFTTDTGVEPSTVIPDGILPREIGEYRSYLQLPFIYWNKLFQIFQEKSEAVTGYQFELDSSWFNTLNPYWYNMVYMLNGFSYSHENIETNKYELAWRNNNTYWSSTNYTQNKGTTMYTNYHDEGGGGAVIGERVYHMEESVPIYDTDYNLWASGIYGIHINTTFDVNLTYQQFYKDGSYRETKLGTNNGLKLKFAVVDSDTSTEINNYTVFICASNYVGTIPTVDAVINVDNVSTSTSAHYSTIQFNVPVYLYSAPNKNARLSVSGGWYNNNVPFVQEDGSSTAGTTPIYLPTIYLNNTPSYKDFTLTDEKRSYSRFTLNDLWNKDYNLFNEILKYCKMYRIGITTDEYNKKIIFKPIIKYFENYTVNDWTNKVDKSKDFIITPITFDNKYILFNYKDSETELGSGYKEKYGVNYGDYKLTTDYNFNTEIKNLFNDITASITNTDNVLSWLNLSNHRIIYSFPAELSIYNQDKDKKQVNIFGAYFFHNGTSSFSTEEKLNLPSVRISDDSILQENISTYFYTTISTDLVECNKYPKLDIVNGDNLCVFNVPKENYTYLNNYEGKQSIYTNFWEKYLNERYNIQNKIITCYVMLKPQEYNQFRWNKLIKLGNQLCMVNKIYDYDITNNQPTKVDLITIIDITGYSTNNYS